MARSKQTARKSTIARVPPTKLLKTKASKKNDSEVEQEDTFRPAKKWILNKDFSGEPTEENLKLVDFELQDNLQENEVLCQAVYFSVDPYMRVWGKKEGQIMIGEQLSEVIQSKNGKFPVGTLVLSKAGWVTHYVSKGDDLNLIRFDLGKFPISYTLGVLGMTGATAYFGVNKCDVKQDDVFVVSCAAGAVGSVAGQLAKMKGAKVIGLVGNDEKVKFCKQELGFDHVFNYKTCNINEEIKKVAPEGVDVYYDNAGGTFYTSIIEHNMKNNGRVLDCGSIQTYCTEEKEKLEKNVDDVIKSKNLSVIEFRAYNQYDEWPKAFNELSKYIQDGKLKVKEHCYTGFEKMRDAFYGLFKGENIGKALVKMVNQQTNFP